MSLPLNINLQQILLHAFNLCLLFGGLYLLLYKPVKKFMDNRAAKYQSMDEEANKKLTLAAETEEKAAKSIEDAKRQILSDKETARREAEDEAEKIIKEAKKAKKKMLDDAEEAALRERNRIINDAREDIAELAIRAAEKVLNDKNVSKENGND